MIETHGFNIIGFLAALHSSCIFVNVVALTQIKNPMYGLLVCVYLNIMIDSVLTLIFFRVPKATAKNIKFRLYTHKIWIYIAIIMVCVMAFMLTALVFAEPPKLPGAVFLGLMGLPMKIYIFKETNYLEEINKARNDAKSLELV